MSQWRWKKVKFLQNKTPAEKWWFSTGESDGLKLATSPKKKSLIMEIISVEGRTSSIFKASKKFTSMTLMPENHPRWLYLLNLMSAFKNEPPYRIAQVERRENIWRFTVGDLVPPAGENADCSFFARTLTVKLNFVEDVCHASVLKELSQLAKLQG